MNDRGYQPDLGYALAESAYGWNLSYGRPGHWLTLVPEEPAEGDRMWANEVRSDGSWPGDEYRRQRGDTVLPWDIPWVRPVCSCGWKGGTKRGRFTIEGNAAFYWATRHMQKLEQGEAP